MRRIRNEGNKVRIPNSGAAAWGAGTEGSKVSAGQHFINGLDPGPQLSRQEVCRCPSQMEPIALGGRHASTQVGVARDGFRRAKGGIRQGPTPEVEVAGDYGGRLKSTPTLGGSSAAEEGAGNKVPDNALH